MIGHTVESPSRIPWGTLFFLVSGIVALGGAVALRDPHWAVFAVLPMAVAIALWRTTPQRFLATVHEDRIELLEPRETIQYESMRSVSISNPGNSNAVLLIVHDSGAIRIPASVDVSIKEFEEFLKKFVPSQPRKEPNPVLNEYVREQRERFGDDRVWVYLARRNHFGSGTGPGQRRVTVSLACIGAGILWCFAPMLIQGEESSAWIGVGMLLAFTAFLLWLVFRQSEQAIGSVPRKVADSCLVISPLGIAMVQGDMRGKLLWDEIRKVSRKGQSRSFQASSTYAGLHLIVEGSLIFVQNIYDAPLSEIESNIRRHL